MDHLLTCVISRMNYFIYIGLMVLGMYGIFIKKNYLKKIIGMNILQTAIILFFISIGAKREASIPIIEHHGHGGSHEMVQAVNYINPLPHVLMLTAIVVAVATLGVALAMVIKIYHEFASVEEGIVLSGLNDGPLQGHDEQEGGMITPDQLKQFVLLSYLSDSMLETLVPITEMFTFDENERIFSQGDPADRLFLLKQGKVLLENRIAEKITVSMASIKPGYSFGWSAMLTDDVYSSDAMATEPSLVFSFKEHELKRKMNQDHSLGFIISRRMLNVIKKRYDVRTEQFGKTIKLHPEISRLL